MDAEHKCLLLHTEIRWLSREKSLNRVFELREPLQKFLFEKNSDVANKLKDENWVLELPYLCDIFNLLKKLNLPLQGNMTTLFKLADQVAAFKEKLKLWEQRVNKRGIWHISNISRLWKTAGLIQAFSDLVRSHLRVLLQEFKRYFPSAKDPRTAKKWIRNPFIFKPGESTLPMRQQDQLLDTANDGSLNVLYNDSTNVLDEGLTRIPRPCHKSIKNFAAISDILLVRVWIFCDGSNKDEIAKQTGREWQIAGVIEFHNAKVGASRCGKTSSSFSLNQSCNNLYELQ